MLNKEFINNSWFIDCPFITARKRSLGQGNMFTDVCLSTGGVPGPGGCLVEIPPRTATAAGGTQPTGMHSCFTFEITFHWFR